MTVQPVKLLLGIAGRLFQRRLGDGWSIAETKNGRVAVKSLMMSDGTQSFAGTGKGFVIIYRQDCEDQDYSALQPLHVLLETSVENLSRFYSPEYSSEIYSVYKRFNRENI